MREATCTRAAGDEAGAAPRREGGGGTFLSLDIDLSKRVKKTMTWARGYYYITQCVLLELLGCGLILILDVD